MLPVYRVYLDSIYNARQRKNLTNDRIISILRLEASKPEPPPAQADPDDYFRSKGLK